MYTNSEFTHIKKTYLSEVRIRNVKLFNIWLAIFSVFVIGFGILFVLVPDILTIDPWNWLIPVYGFIPALIVFLITITIYKYVSEIPAFNYLYSEIYKKINIDESLFIKYEPYLKEKQDFNIKGGLYTRYASAKIKRKVSGQTMNRHDFTIYDTTIVSSNGQSSTTHFNGIYYQIKTNTNTYFQVRTHGTPKMKGIKYIKKPEYQDIRVFVREGLQLNSELNAYIKFVRKYKDKFEIRAFDLSVIPGETHLGIWYKKHPARKQKNLSLDKINEIYKYFLEELDFADQIISLDKED